MTGTRIFFALILALLVAACSQVPEDVQPPLNPQYGTAGSDSGLRVTVKGDSIYVAGAEGAFGSVSGEDVAEFALRRFDRQGNLIWRRALNHESCEQSDWCSISVWGVDTDATGNVYALYSEDLDLCYEHHFVVKYSPSGSLLWKREFSNLCANQGLTVTDDGHAYVAGYYFNYPDEETASQLRKFSPSGNLLWEQDLDIRNVTDVAAVGNNTLYVAGAGGLGRYTSSGGQVWKQKFPERLFTVGFYEGVHVTTSGSNAVFIAGNTPVQDEDSYEEHPRIHKYSADGSLEWRRVVVPIGRAALSDVGADGSGNAYITGWTDQEEDGNADLFVRKYLPGGKVGWTTVLKLPKTYEYAHAVAARSSSEVYATGQTDATVNGKNYGRSDGFLLRLNGQGNKVWSR